MLLLSDAPFLEVHFCSSTVSSDKFRIFLMENEFSLAENEETPGVEDAIPLVAIMVTFPLKVSCYSVGGVKCRRL